MNTVVNESKIESGAEMCTCSNAERCGHALGEVTKRLTDAKEAVTETLEDGKIAAERMLKQSQQGIEDCIAVTGKSVKEHPVSSLVIAFAAGVALGVAAPRIVK